jgi:integrase
MIYRRKSVWWLDFTIGGKRYRQSTGLTSKSLALQLHDQLKYEIASGKAEKQQSESTFGEHAESWYERKVNIKPSTRTSYRGILDNHLLPYFGEMRVVNIERNHILDYVKDEVAEGDLSPKTLNNILVTLHQILQEAKVEKLITENPFFEIDRPESENVERDYLRTHEIPIFLENCEPKTSALFYTAIFTGMRRGELLGLKWKDFDWVNGKIHVCRTNWKGKLQTPKSKYSKRKIDMGPRLTQVLKEHRLAQNQIRLKAGRNWVDNDLVFCSHTGDFLDGDNLYHRDFKPILKKAGLRHMRIHDLRHTYASILIAAGHSPKYIQMQLGHSSIMVTMDLYGHLMEEVYEGAAKKSEDFVFASHLRHTEQQKGATACAVTP